MARGQYFGNETKFHRTYPTGERVVITVVDRETGFHIVSLLNDVPKETADQLYNDELKRRWAGKRATLEQLHVIDIILRRAHRYFRDLLKDLSTHKEGQLRHWKGKDYRGMYSDLKPDVPNGYYSQKETNILFLKLANRIEKEPDFGRLTRVQRNNILEYLTGGLTLAFGDQIKQLATSRQIAGTIAGMKRLGRW